MEDYIIITSNNSIVMKKIDLFYFINNKNIDTMYTYISSTKLHSVSNFDHNIVQITSDNDIYSY